MKIRGKFLHYFFAILVILIWIIPILWTIDTSLKPTSEIFSPTPRWFGFRPTLDNFREAWNSAPFARYYLNSTIIVGVTLIIQLIIILPAAYAFARLKFPGRDLLFYLYLLQLMLPVPALIFPNYTTMRSLHLIDTKWAVILPYAASAFGMFLLRQGFRTIPQDFEDAALIDGCNWFQIMRHVYIPMVKPIILAFSLNSIIYHWNEFIWPLIVINSPQNRTVTLGLAMFSQSEESGANWTVIMAGTLMVIIPLLILFAIFQKKFIESFIHSGLKG